MMRVAGSVVSTGEGAAAGGGYLCQPPMRLGAFQVCSAAHWSKQARRACLSSDSAVQRRQALSAPEAVAGVACAHAASAGARAAKAESTSAAVRHKGPEAVVASGGLGGHGGRHHCHPACRRITNGMTAGAGGVGWALFHVPRISLPQLPSTTRPVQVALMFVPLIDSSRVRSPSSTSPLTCAVVLPRCVVPRTLCASSGWGPSCSTAVVGGGGVRAFGGGGGLQLGQPAPLQVLVVHVGGGRAGGADF